MSKPIKCTTPRGNCNVNYGLGVIMTRQCGLINCSKCILQWRMIMGRLCMCRSGKCLGNLCIFLLVILWTWTFLKSKACYTKEIHDLRVYSKQQRQNFWGCNLVHLLTLQETFLWILMSNMSLNLSNLLLKPSLLRFITFDVRKL